MKPKPCQSQLLLHSDPQGPLPSSIWCPLPLAPLPWLYHCPLAHSGCLRLNRHYYIGTKETTWNYAPTGKNMLNGKPIPEDQ